jgi:hypothetical protein
MGDPPAEEEAPDPIDVGGEAVESGGAGLKAPGVAGAVWDVLPEPLDAWAKAPSLVKSAPANTMLIARNITSLGKSARLNSGRVARRSDC